MRNFYLLLFSVFSFALCAQNSIPNGGFENWTSTSFNQLDNYVTRPGISLFITGALTTTRSNDRFNGNFSIRMETKSTAEDTIAGVFTSGDFDTENGFPYSQQPDSIVGYYKSDVKAGDSAFIVVRFSNAGTIFSFQVIDFVGVQNSWTRFSVPLNLAMTPDSMFIAATSSNLINEVGIQPGSWLMLDSLHFVGTGITQQIVNGDFENWTSSTFEEPSFWSTTNAATAETGSNSATRTTDSHSGISALRLETIVFFEDDTFGIVSNGVFGDSIIRGGQPFSSTFDTLVGYYKYSPIGLDTAGVSLTFFRNGNIIGGSFNTLTAQSTYTEFRIPFVLPQVPDTMRIDIFSSIGEDIVGSTLFIDGLTLNSIITSLDKNLEEVKNLKLYPNPASDQLNINFSPLERAVELQLMDALGRVYQREMLSKGQMGLALELSPLKKGIYYLRLIDGQKMVHRSFIKN